MSDSVTVQHRVLDRAVDTEAAFLRLYSTSATAFWLDSEHVEPGLDRFSFLGDAAGPLAEVVQYRVGSGYVTVTGSGGRVRREPGTVLDYLAAALRTRFLPLPAQLPFDFAGGYVGYLGYEVKADCGGTAGYRATTPDAQWIFADRLVVVDHLAGRTHLVALTGPEEAARQACESWLGSTAAALEQLPTWTNPEPLDTGPGPATTGIGGHGAAGAGPAHSASDSDPAGSAVEDLLARGRGQYLRDIAACQAALRAGESYEITLTDQLSLPATAGGLDTYRILRRANPAPYSAYLRFDDLEIVCSSPERFLKVDRTRTVETKPIKGTARRDPDPAVDEQLRRALTEDPKTRAENVMIVDLLRNDLGRVCEIGSVRVRDLLVTETYSTLHQLVSTVRGTLRADTDVIACLRACFPGGSMTGAPKIRTMEIIDELETRARGVYSGTIGFLGLGGTADLNIVIRTAVRHGGRWQIGAGGAIVLDSVAADEYDEMLLKAQAVYRAVSAVEAGQFRPSRDIPAGIRAIPCGRDSGEPGPDHANSATMERWHSSG
ncbi:aminodeoxychorismate synthase component I [Nocardia carnea]|uniref:aminodeoxychorismate synthase component I n=1 Tax=Nocardia carnea TaxID=37328 RepID=UPI002455AD4E|nr:aminodeoxychorismate synthase component I [Nocardia carnea]